MTVTNPATKVVIAGNGATTAFDFGFIAVDTTDIVVIYTDAAGVQTLLGPTAYGIALNAVDSGALWAVGGAVIYPLAGAPIAGGTSLTIARILPLLQTISIQNQTALYLQVIERALDYGVMVTQQLAEQQARMAQGPISDPAGVNYTLPTIAQRARQFLGFDPAGNVTVGLPSNAIVSAALQAFVSAASLAAARNVLGVGSVIDVGPANGVDDTAAINALIQASPAPCTLRFAGGQTYNINNGGLVLRSGVSLNLNGATLKALVIGKLPAFYNMVFGNSVTNFEIYGGTFDVSGTTVPGGSTMGIIGIGGAAEGNWRVHHCRFIGIGATDWAAIGTTSGFNFEVEYNYFEKLSTSNTFAQSVNISGGSPDPTRIVISNNIMNGLGIDAQCSRFICENNIVYGVRYGAGIAGGNANSFSAVITGNIVSDCVGIDSNGFPVDGIQSYFPTAVIANNCCFNNGGSGLSLGGNNCVVTGNVMSGNGTAATGEAGITVVYSGAGAYQNGSNSLIANNRCFDAAGGAGTQSYGIQDNATNVGMKYYSNDCDGNKTANYNIGSASPSFQGNVRQLKVSWTPGAIANGASATDAITFAGVNAGDFITASIDGLAAGLLLSANSSGANVVLVNLGNLSGGALTPGVVTLRIQATERLA